MAIAASIIDRNHVGHKQLNLVEFTLSGTYTTGGESPSLASLGLDQRFDFLGSESAEGLTVKGAGYGTAVPRVRLMRTDQVDDSEEEVPNGTAIAGTFRALVYGQ